MCAVCVHPVGVPQTVGYGCDNVPFSLLLTLSLAMAVSRLTEHAVVHLGLYNARQVCSWVCLSLE